MSDNNGWPGKPGVPLNPERDGWHWVKTGHGLSLWLWEENSESIMWDYGWETADGLLSAANFAAMEPCIYLGPCLTPGEVDARVSEVMKWRTAIYDALIEWHDPPRDDETPKAALRRLVHTEILAALDPAVSRLAADLVAQALRDALEEAAQWHDEQRESSERGLEYSSLVGIPIANATDLRSSAKTHEWCAAAIRALSDTPSGMVLVPLEPTSAMIQACLQAALDFMAKTKTTEVHPRQTYPSPSENARRCWRAMVQAAGKGEGDE
jgi:hypothetical protein